MRARADITGLTVGLLFVLVAALGLWSAFGRVDWAGFGIVAPLCLVVVGLIGLSFARRK